MEYTPKRHFGTLTPPLFDRVSFMSKSTASFESLDPVGQIVGYARVSTVDQNLSR